MSLSMSNYFTPNMSCKNHIHQTHIDKYNTDILLNISKNTANINMHPLTASGGGAISS